MTTRRGVLPGILAAGFAPAAIGSGQSDGAEKVGFLQAANGAVARTVQDKMREVFSVKDFGAVGDGVTDDTAAISIAINAANGKELFFPAGTYLVTDSLSITVWRYSLAGERNERGCNALGQTPDYATTRIVFAPTDTTKSLISRSDVSAPYSGIIGPFEHKHITFVFGRANGFTFGNARIPPGDGKGEKYIFGVRFNGCALHATAANRASDTAGVITRSGRTLVSMTKCFESSIVETSLYGCDTQIRTFGCDKPVLRGVRSQGAHVPIDFNGSGSFAVQYTVDDLQVEGWTFTPVKSFDNSLTVSNSKFEQNDGNPVGSGTVNMTTAYGYRAAVTAGSDTLVFSAAMDHILFPQFSILRITDGVNDEYCYVTRVSGTSVTISTTCFAFNWSAASATVYRIHGYGPLHYSNYDAAYSNIVCGASLNTPALVYVASRGSMHITGAVAQAGRYGDIHSLAIGNVLESSSYLNQQMTFANCAALVCADSMHPYVTISNWGESGEAITPRTARSKGGDLFDSVATAKKVWAWTPKRTATSSRNVHKTPFKKYPGDAFTSQSFYAWQVPAATNFHINDQTLPSISRGMLLISIRCKAVSKTDTLSIVAAGVGGRVVARIAITNDTFRTYDRLISLPDKWSASRANAAELLLSATGGVLIQSVTLEDRSEREVRDFISDNVAVSHKTSKKTFATGTPAIFAKVDLSALSSQGGTVRAQLHSVQTAPNSGYSSTYADFNIQYSYTGGALVVLGAVAQLSQSAMSVNSAVSANSISVSAKIVGTDFELTATVSATGSHPSTLNVVNWTLEAISSYALDILAV